MEETISLYVVAKSTDKGTKRINGISITKAEFEKSQLTEIFEEAEKYQLYHYVNSYYESYYDDTTEYYASIKYETILLKNGKLFGFVFEEYGGVLLLTDADTRKTIEIYYSSTDHGDTMSGEEHTMKLVTKKTDKSKN